MKNRLALSAEWRSVVAAVMESLGVAAWEWDLVSGEVWWSDNFGILVGRERGYVPEGLDEAMSVFGSDPTRPGNVEDVIRLAAERNGPIEVERVARLPDGSPRWMHHRYSVTVDEAAEPVRLFGLAIDIDDRKRREQQDALMLEVGRLLAGSSASEETLPAIAELVVAELADWCVVELLQDGSLQLAALAHDDPERARWARELRAQSSGDVPAEFGASKVVRTGVPELHQDIDDEALVQSSTSDDVLAMTFREFGCRSAMVVPLRVRGEIIGAITLIAGEGQQRFDSKSLEFGESLASLIAGAIDNARLFRRAEELMLHHRQVARTLQEGLQPAELPRINGVSAAAAYEPSGQAEAGGDWYELFETADGKVAVVIGDVVGHGVATVAAMARVRHTLSAHLLAGSSPAKALEETNRAVFRFVDDAQRLMTAAVVVIGADRRHALVALAGHPAVFVRNATTARMLDESTGMPLGVDLNATWSETSVELDPRCLLFMYTDGWIDYPGADIPGQLDDLEAILRAGPMDCHRILAEFRRRFDDPDRADDAAALAVLLESDR